VELGVVLAGSFLLGLVLEPFPDDELSEPLLEVLLDSEEDDELEVFELLRLSVL
jgi:hypothetical protein